MKKTDRQPEEIIEVRRKAGRIRKITTSADRSYILLDEPGNSQFLVPGTVLGGSDLEDLEGPLATAAGLIFSCNLLSRRERSEMQVREALRREGVEKNEVIDYIVETLRGRGYLDDRRFARELVRYRRDVRCCGPGLIRRKLRESGIDQTVIDEEILAGFPDGEEERLAADLAEARMQRSKNIERKRAVRRIHGLLSRRGFSTGIINSICAGLLRGEVSERS